MSAGGPGRRRPRSTPSCSSGPCSWPSPPASTSRRPPSTAAGSLLYLARRRPVLLAVGAAVVHRGTYRYGSFEELTALAVVVGVSAVAGLAFAVLVPPPTGAGRCRCRSPLVSAALALIGDGRAPVDRAPGHGRGPSAPSARHRSGCSSSGRARAATRSSGPCSRTPPSPYLPVGAARRRPGQEQPPHRGRPGRSAPREDLARVAAPHRGRRVVIAVRSASAADVRDPGRDRPAPPACSCCRCRSTSKMLGRASSASATCGALTVEDLLGRHQIRTDVHEIAMLPHGPPRARHRRRRVDRLRAVPADPRVPPERADHARPRRVRPARRAAEHRGPRPARLRRPRPRRHPRPARACDEVFAEHRPDVVFHAAALKHLPLLEANPGEAVQTNVWGTLNVLEAARSAGVERFVNISTDKAADPMSVLGWSKRIAERLTAEFARDGSRYMSRPLRQRPRQPGLGAADVRRPARARRARHPHRRPRHPVLHDACRRRSSSSSRPGPSAAAGESLVLDMGEPVRIAELAARLADLRRRHGRHRRDRAAAGREAARGPARRATRSARDPPPPHHPRPRAALDPSLVLVVDPWRPRDAVRADLEQLADTLPGSAAPRRGTPRSAGAAPDAGRPRDQPHRRRRAGRPDAVTGRARTCRRPCSWRPSAS